MSVVRNAQPRSQGLASSRSRGRGTRLRNVDQYTAFRDDMKRNSIK